MEKKIEAAAAARQNPDSLFLIARTDALEPEGFDNALRRAERYLKAGADGIYIEAPKSEKRLEQIGGHFKGTPRMTNMFEGDDETPWLTPKELETTAILKRKFRCIREHRCKTGLLRER
jgi:2-methylisocitrate lyase-like PEP mutase family enzyme